MGGTVHKGPSTRRVKNGFDWCLRAILSAGIAMIKSVGSSKFKNFQTYIQIFFINQYIFFYWKQANLTKKDSTRLEVGKSNN